MKVEAQFKVSFTFKIVWAFAEGKGKNHPSEKDSPSSQSSIKRQGCPGCCLSQALSSRLFSYLALAAGHCYDGSPFFLFFFFWFPFTYLFILGKTFETFECKRLRKQSNGAPPRPTPMSPSRVEPLPDCVPPPRRPLSWPHLYSFTTRVCISRRDKVSLSTFLKWIELPLSVLSYVYLLFHSTFYF